jgi:hypothetical protein
MYYNIRIHIYTYIQYIFFISKYLIFIISFNLIIISCSLEHTERHGVGKPIGTIELIDSSIHLVQEKKTKGVFTSTFYTIEDTNG